VSTAIVIFRKGGSTSKVWMYRVDNDGYSAGDTRSAIDKNDIPDLLAQYADRHSYDYSGNPLKHRWVSREEIIANKGELFPNPYLSPSAPTSEYESKTLGELCTITKGKHAASSDVPGPYPLYTTAERPKTSEDYSFEGEAVLIPLVSSTGHGHASLKRIHYASGVFAAASILAVLRPKSPQQISVRFLHQYLSTFKDELLVIPHMSGTTNNSLSLQKISSVQVPVPPVDVQDEIIAELIELEQQRGEMAAKAAQIDHAINDALDVFRGTFLD
jgi:hypothetical protein